MATVIGDRSISNVQQNNMKACTGVELYVNVKVKSPVTGLEWPRGLQEFKVSRFRDSNTRWW